MNTRQILVISLLATLIIALLFTTDVGVAPNAQAAEKTKGIQNKPGYRIITQAEREAAADRAKAARELMPTLNAQNLLSGGGGSISTQAVFTPGPTSVPDYFGIYPNYALSSLPVRNPEGTVVTGTGIRKFMDKLPGLTDANANLLVQDTTYNPTPNPAYGQYIPVATPGTLLGNDYYEIAVVQYKEKMHTDLPQTTLRGYVQIETSAQAGVTKHIQLFYPDGSPIDGDSGTGGVQPVFAVDPPSYLGPTIVADTGAPVRIKFTNYLPTGAGGDLFLPTDTTVMGAGMGSYMVMAVSAAPVVPSSPTVRITTMDPQAFIVGESVHLSGFTPDAYNGHYTIVNVPDTTHFDVTLATDPGGAATVVGSVMSMSTMYTQNRATLHLHGGATPWISDGTPHQWITPAGENTHYPQGVSVVPVPDMSDTGNATDGSMTFYYTNQQSARLMFYHDHAYGITRLNVYAGEAAPYVLRDTTEIALRDGGTVGGKTIAPGTIPADEIPLVIQDKTFVPEDYAGDYTSVKGTFGSQLEAQDPTWDTAKWGGPGSLWMAHVYMPNENPADISGMNAMGRWFYGPWFHPPTTDLTFGPVPNPYVDPINAPWENSVIPGTPDARLMGPSMGMEAFMDTPVVNGTAYPYLEVQPKAYRFRVLNAADDRFFNLQWYLADSGVTTPDGRNLTEIKMVPAEASQHLPEGWPTDGRDGGVPDPATAGPSWIQIGNEGGFLPAPVTLNNKPVTWNLDQTNFDFGNINGGTLILGTAERADVIVDFSQYAGKTLILYNDSPAPFPAIDPRYDYYTGAPDKADTGGAPYTLAGFGPNTRTIMQVRVVGNNEQYVPSLYQEILGRSPDPGGLASWTAALNSGVPRSDIAYAFMSSAERFGIFITEQYQLILGRAPDSGGLAGWTNAMVSGLSERSLMASLYGSPEYAITQVGNQSNEGFVATLYQQILGRSPDPGGLASWTAALNSGVPRSDIAYAFMSSAERFGIFITEQYQLILGRAPDAGGFNSWTNGMIAGISERALMAELYGSTEYIGVLSSPALAFDKAPLEAAFASTATTQGVFEVSQDPVLVPADTYNSAYNQLFAADPYVRIQDFSSTFTPMDAVSPVTIEFDNKAIQDEMGEAFDKEYGRMSGFLGLEVPRTDFSNMNFLLYPFASPPVDVTVDNVTPSVPAAGDGTQIWKITHNGVDTHTIHVHLFNVQLINRVAWDGALRLPDANELGWKETVRVNPLQDTIVALRPVAPTLPFAVPNSVRLLDPTMPEGHVLTGGQLGFQDPLSNPATITNERVNFGWEYVYHCHILSHEEMDMMHEMSLAVTPVGDPSGLIVTLNVGVSHSLSWADNSTTESGFTIQWAPTSGGPWAYLATVPAATGTGTTVNYTDLFSGTRYYRVAAGNTPGALVSTGLPFPNFPTVTAYSGFTVPGGP